MRLSQILPAVLACITITQAIQTSIFIDRIPGYSALAVCAEDRVSAIVRAQASGCGDNRQLTSFSCFCLDRSSQMASIISTAVEKNCAASATTLLASATTPLAEVTKAVRVFESYCAKSTELVWYQNNSTASSSNGVITPAPSSTFTTSVTTSAPASQGSTSSKSVPVAAIAAPVVVGVLAIASVVGLLFFLRRRKAASKKEVPYEPATSAPRGELDHGQLYEVQSPAQEVVGETVKYQYELGNTPSTTPAELEGEKQSGYRPPR